MFIASANFKLKLEEFQKDDSIPLLSNETEKKVFWLAKQWLSDEKTFTFHTSGSTGRPKKRVIDRQKIIDSTNFTFDFIDPDRKIKNCLLCLDPSFIGGAMVVFRALIMNLDLYVIEPTSSITQSLPSQFKTHLVSMVPMQFKSLSNDEINRFKNILIGGAPMEMVSKANFNSNIFSTYGMTETVSHIALRKIDEPSFTTIGDMSVCVDDDECLQFKGTMTENKWLKTNDLGEVISDNQFRWIGRKDFIINSGGIKLNPEMIEQKLSSQMTSRFLISSIPDEVLTEKVVLIVEDRLSRELDYEALSKYERPKLIMDNHEIAFTQSGKIDRIATRKRLIESQK